MRSYLGRDSSTLAVIMHKHTQYLWYYLWQVYLELRAYGIDDLLHHQDYCVLHWTV